MKPPRGGTGAIDAPRTDSLRDRAALAFLSRVAGDTPEEMTRAAYECADRFLAERESLASGVRT